MNDIYIDSKISEYILNIVFATRNPREFNLSKLVDLISFGASPRASINLVLASKAKAFINGRGYVIPEDVKYVAKDILRHRILLSYEAEAEEITSEDIIDQLLQEVPVPWLKMSKEILKKVRQIEIRTKNIVNDFFGGDYHSNFKGRGMTFSEVREYVPGDDVRSIDWNVTARTGKPHIKIFEEERELSVLILIDVSSSGVFGSKKDLKIDLGVEIAAMLSFSAIKNNDKVGLALFSDKVEKYIPPKKGKKHVLRLITDIVNHDFENSNKRTSIKNAIDFANKISKRKSVIFLISDFIDDNFWNELKFLNFKHDLIGLQIYDSYERNFPNIGLINIHDSETGNTTWIDTSSKKNRVKFEKYSDEKLIKFSKKCKNIGFDLLQINTDDDYVKFLMQFFRSRAKRS